MERGMTEQIVSLLRGIIIPIISKLVFCEEMTNMQGKVPIFFN